MPDPVILYPSEDVTVEGWEMLIARFYKSTVLYQAINEAIDDEPENIGGDGDLSFIYTIDPVSTKGAGPYECLVGGDTEIEGTSATASVTAMGPKTAVPDKVAPGFQAFEPKCHINLNVEILDAAGEKLGGGPMKLSECKYKTETFDVDLSGGYQAPFHMKFTPEKNGGNANRFCRITQAQITVYPPETRFV